MNRAIKTMLLLCACCAVFLTHPFAQALELPQITAPSDVDYQRNESGITIHAENMELSVLLKLLSIYEEANIIGAGSITGSVCVNLYNVSLHQVLDAVLKPNGYDYFIQDGIYLVMKKENLASFLTPPSDQVVRIFTLNYINLTEAEKFITPLLSEGAQFVAGEKPAQGLASGDSDSGGDASTSNNMILIKDREEVIRKIEETLAVLDVRPRQVLVEATILEVYLNDSCKLGVDFNALGGIDFSDLGSTSNLFSVTPQDASGTTLDHTLYGMRDTGFASNNPGEGFSFGILHEKVGLFIEAMENVADTDVVANPKVLALNRQKAEIIIGGRLGYYGTETVNQGVSQQNVEFLETGTQLRFRPFISGDGFVRLEIHPGRSNGIIDVTTGLPSETTSEVTTNIMVKNGDTIVIGGLIEEKDTSIEKRVPLLGSIPYLGALFRRTETETLRTEIIILITPYILDPASMDSEAEEAVRTFNERKRFFREGFLFCSRTVHAERHASKAWECLRANDLKWAEFHLARVKDLNPHHADVQALVKRIEGDLPTQERVEEPMDGYLTEVLR